MKYFTLEEILEDKLKDPEFKAGFEAEKRVLEAELAAERSQASSPSYDRSHEHSYGARV